MRADPGGINLPPADHATGGLVVDDLQVLAEQAQPVKRPREILLAERVDLQIYMQSTASTPVVNFGVNNAVPAD